MSMLDFIQLAAGILTLWTLVLTWASWMLYRVSREIEGDRRVLHRDKVRMLARIEAARRERL
jgi:hypothetical protein